MAKTQSDILEKINDNIALLQKENHKSHIKTIEQMSQMRTQMATMCERLDNHLESNKDKWSEQSKFNMWIKRSGIGSVFVIAFGAAMSFIFGR